MFNCCVDARDPHDGHLAATVGGGPTREEAIADAKRYADFYRNERGYVIEKVEINESCPACQGTGHKPSKRRRLFPKPCPKCKGQRVVNVEIVEV